MSAGADPSSPHAYLATSGVHGDTLCPGAAGGLRRSCQTYLGEEERKSRAQPSTRHGPDVEPVLRQPRSQVLVESPKVVGGALTCPVPPHPATRLWAVDPLLWGREGACEAGGGECPAHASSSL